MAQRRTERHGGTWLTVAVAAGCAAATLTTGPSWALPPDPRPAVQLAPADQAAAPSGSDLQVVRIDPDPAPPGGTTTVHAFVGNRGPDTTAAPFTVVVALPKGVTAEGPYFPDNCRVRADGRQVHCTFGPGLREGRSATALVPVRLSPELSAGVLHGGQVEVRSPDDRDPRNNRQPFDVKVAGTAAG